MSESAILIRVSRAYRLDPAPCFNAARDVKARLGYEVAGGYYDRGGGFWDREGHFWNVRPDGSIVDVTHFQFDADVPIMIAAPGSTDAARYVRGGLEDMLARLEVGRR